jgi:CHAD domain-containing protein
MRHGKAWAAADRDLFVTTRPPTVKGVCVWGHMAYRLKLKEPLVKGVRRIATEQLANAAARLQGDSDPESGVHEARKSLKRTRALLRLVRPGLGETQFRKFNERLRDIARTLSAARDREVVRAHLARLTTAKPSIAKAAGRLSTALAQASHDRAPDKGAGSTGPITDKADALVDIDAVRAELAQIELHPASFDTIIAGLTKSHRSGCKALALALASPDEEEALHDLRKAAQAYWRQMILVQHAWPEVCLARAAAAKHVADLLGHDHDVTLLEGGLAGPEAQALTRAERSVLTRYCAVRHAEMRGAALPKAQLLFAERSERLGERIRYFWDLSRKTARPAVTRASADEAAGARKS